MIVTFQTGEIRCIAGREIGAGQTGSEISIKILEGITSTKEAKATTLIVSSTANISGCITRRAGRTWNWIHVSIHWFVEGPGDNGTVAIRLLESRLTDKICSWIGTGCSNGAVCTSLISLQRLVRIQRADGTI